jgi:hypothetical protein
VFLLSDNVIIDEKFLEDINNLLNIGEIPNLFAPDEKEGVINHFYMIFIYSNNFMNFNKISFISR